MGANDDYLPQNYASLQLGEIWQYNELIRERSEALAQAQIRLQTVPTDKMNKSD